ncbi:MAG: single-stranded DNA-binding protein [Nocardioidaceae bacterium]|nr:single-stranded DNA-binding protein [Nocardioidaceae bacterium]
MPSGDEMTTFRVIVRRPPAALRKSKVTVDSVECVAWTAATRRSASRLEPGDVVEVTGALRRRFQRSGDGPVSRVDVEVDRCRRVPEPGRRRRASPSDA